MPGLAVDVPDQLLLDLERLAVTAWSARERPAGRRGRTLVAPEAVAAVAADPHRSLLGARARELATQRTWAVAVDELETLLRPGAGARAAG